MVDNKYTFPFEWRGVIFLDSFYNDDELEKQTKTKWWRKANLPHIDIYTVIYDKILTNSNSVLNSN